MSRSPIRTVFLLFSASFALMASGCSTADDNPTSAEKMQSIRQQESQSRQNFHPGGAPPGK